MIDPVIRLLSHLLTPMFFFGLVGAGFVVVLSVVHDMVDIMTPEEEMHQSDNL